MNYERKYKEALEKIKGTLFYRENSNSLTRKLDADKVIAWLVANIIDFEYYVRLFKKDFEL